MKLHRRSWRTRERLNKARYSSPDVPEAEIKYETEGFISPPASRVVRNSFQRGDADDTRLGEKNSSGARRSIPPEVGAIRNCGRTAARYRFRGSPFRVRSRRSSPVKISTDGRRARAPPSTRNSFLEIRVQRGYRLPRNPPELAAALGAREGSSASAKD